MIGKERSAELRALFAANPQSKEFPKEALEYIYDEELFRLFIPKALNGRQCSLPEAMRIVEDCARVDGDFGWAVQIGNGGGFFAGFFDEKTARKFFTDPKFVIAGSGFPGGKAKSEGEAFRVSGEWKFASGSGYASLFTANCFIDGSDQVRACAFLPEQVEILDDWDAYGMRRTLSDSIKVEDVRVSASMTFDTAKVVNDYGYPLYQFPFMQFARACILGTLSGCFGHLLEVLENYIGTSQARSERKEKLDDLHASLSLRHSKISERVYASAEKAWSETELDKAPSQEATAEFDAAMKVQISFINEEAHNIFHAVGLAATVHSSAFNKVWRDLTTAAQHVILKI